MKANKKNFIIYGLLFVLVAILLSLFSCESPEDMNDCGCTKTTYVRLVVNNHLTTQVESFERIDCEDEGSKDIDNTHYYTISCE
jgi:hypothetical protein